MIFLSNQLRPIEEAEKVRQVILKDFPAPVEFVVDEPGPWVARVKAEAQAGQVSVGLLGGLHADYAAIPDTLDPLDDVMTKLADRGFAAPVVELAKLGTDHVLYVPWMQATYIMVANKTRGRAAPGSASAAMPRARACIARCSKVSPSRPARPSIR
jgi:multiple sugar transport system substrate-binding protein